MAKIIEDLTLGFIEDMAGKDHGEYLDNEMIMAMSIRRLGRKILKTGQPYRIGDGRIMRVTQGTARCIINMEQHTMQAGTILVVPPDSVFEVEMMDDSFDLQFVSFKDLPADVTFNSCIELQLTNDDMELTGEYFHLLYHTVNRQPLSMQSTRALLTGMLNELHALHERTTVNTQKTPSRQQEILQRFITLLNRHAAKEHNISFYADRLCLTPNHLGATIREASGLTAMQWIHRYIIQQAKLQLFYSDHPVWQISETLNFPNPSFFSKFFKRETGMTPAEYRQMK